ncbi:alanine--glyoxylate aminotransferase family protein [Vibrio breoganii]|uniref:Alanine--glyoxylate aminotransferase n=1 Tax=Vibrio breoganii TaxID=553239 RepID=A0AAN1CST8_9VIBR|nr:alanine--glyoxylate aminotransferase family protein [Vibrio breoganii]ANO33832.1 alanine--glyoxylate aminotransferase [Vibrio breoganii]OED88473.1 alanine--glyoxylate aminotransferase [Vibrio breoganii ZF-55]PMG79715.1 alanine--glyoxylate aminotransferase [Vibrio breoganii]PMO33543.1 alanine--glyoxylate aminotransferase [Vibrio breoganii]PMO57269.1 alanine--glyoxylate aminotransferase [Vibrio breoganii]
MRSFIPPHRTLMGPGPSDISPQVLQALSRPTIGHLDPLFIQMMDELKSLLKYAFQTENEFTIALSAPGSAGMEACFVNLIEPGEKVIVCRNGVFGERMRQNVERCGGVAIVVDDEWGSPVSAQKLQSAVEEHSDAIAVAFVHAETSTGALSDAEALSTIARSKDMLVIVDAVTSLGGVPLMVDEWQLDAVYSGSQKCLSCTPGLSPLTFSSRAIAKIEARQHPVQSWFLDQSLVLGYWSGEGKRAYHHTAPVNSLYALHESLLILKEEGLKQAWKRHADTHQRLKEGLTDLGMSFVVDEEYRLPQLNAVYVPTGIDEALVRQRLLNEYNLEIGAGLGDLAGKAWRIGLMGYGARKENVALCLQALKEVLA